jgi:hypothetical protein
MLERFGLGEYEVRSLASSLEIDILNETVKKTPKNHERKIFS